MSTPSDFAEQPVKFKKLDDLPGKGFGKPHTAAEVMAAMKVLHQMIHAQAKAYGGKNSKLVPAGITETSLLKSVTQLDEIATADVDENLETAYMCCNRLVRHLSTKGDEDGLELVLDVIKHINSALARVHGK